MEGDKTKEKLEFVRIPIQNLEWVTQSENMLHALKNIHINKDSGTKLEEKSSNGSS